MSQGEDLLWLIHDETGDRPFLEVPLPSDPAERDLMIWWLSVAIKDCRATVPKVLEYGGAMGTEGAADLRIMGDSIATLLGWGGFSPVALEMACWFYILGKVGRLVSDYQQRRGGKPDTWLDISVYTMMARRIQAVGRWP
jgi:hypothetical protein